MRTSELLKDCKIKLKISSNYELAKILKIDRARIGDYIAGRRTPNAYAAVKIAECLGLDPLALIAEFEEMTAKNPDERNFWADFRLRAEKPIKGFLLALLCTLSLLAGSMQVKNADAFFRRLKHA